MWVPRKGMFLTSCQVGPWGFFLEHVYWYWELALRGGDGVEGGIPVVCRKE